MPTLHRIDLHPYKHHEINSLYAFFGSEALRIHWLWSSGGTFANAREAIKLYQQAVAAGVQEIDAQIAIELTGPEANRHDRSAAVSLDARPAGGRAAEQ